LGVPGILNFQDFLSEEEKAGWRSVSVRSAQDKIPGCANDGWVQRGGFDVYENFSQLRI